MAYICVYAPTHTNCTSGLRCLFLIPPDNVVQCYVAKLVAIAEICVAIVQWRLMRLGLLTKIDNSTFFRHPIPGVVTSLPLLILIARYM